MHSQANSYGSDRCSVLVLTGVFKFLFDHNSSFTTTVSPYKSTTLEQVTAERGSVWLRSLCPISRKASLFLFIVLAVLLLSVRNYFPLPPENDKISPLG
jgi:hypothetical protein